jgi:hypothetical protein
LLLGHFLLGRDDRLLQLEEGVVQQLLLNVLLKVEQRHVEKIHRLVEARVDLHLLPELRTLVESGSNAHATSGRR